MSNHSNDSNKLEALLEAAVDAIISIDQNGLIQSVNKSTERLFGHENQAFIGRNVKFLMPEPWSSQHDGYLARYQQTGDKRIIGIGREVQGLKSDGSTFPMHLSVSEFSVDGEVFYSGIIHDMSARKQAEDALQRAQKMEAIGQLTGGIAHDFNNLLTIITGNLELLAMQIDAPGQLDLLSEAQDAAELGAELTERLLAFARRTVLEPEIVDLNAMIKNMTGILKRTLDERVSFRMSLYKDLWTARVDRGQVESALLNLAVNARDAMPSGGQLVIETFNTVIDEDYIAREIGLNAGDYVQITVSDTGRGMPQDVVEKAFEPFFTTKETGRGTGLGLSMVYGFAKQSGGHVTLYSELELGTTINIYLPRYGSQQTTVSKAGRQPANFDAPDGLNQLILVVEDDPRVLRLTKQRLEILRYRTIEAPSGDEAIKALANASDIDLVFTDLVMPGETSGYNLAEHVRKFYPHIKVLLTSGYAEDLVHSDKLSEQSIRLLRKPYKQADLARLLQKTLADND